MGIPHGCDEVFDRTCCTRLLLLYTTYKYCRSGGYIQRYRCHEIEGAPRAAKAFISVSVIMECFDPSKQVGEVRRKLQSLLVKQEELYFEEIVRIREIEDSVKT